MGLAFLLLFLGGGRGGGRALLPPAIAAAATGLAAGLAAWACHAGLDWDWEMPAVTLPALLLAAAAIAWSEERRAEADAALPRRGPAAPRRASARNRSADAARSARNRMLMLADAIACCSRWPSRWRPGSALAQSAGDDQYVDPFQDPRDERSGGGDSGSRQGDNEAVHAATQVAHRPAPPPTGRRPRAAEGASARQTPPAYRPPARLAARPRRALCPPRPAGLCAPATCVSRRSRTGVEGAGPRANGQREPALRRWRDAPVVIDARAAARREIGGVERVTIEMAARLPQAASRPVLASCSPQRVRLPGGPPVGAGPAARRGPPCAGALLPRQPRSRASAPDGRGHPRPRRAAPPGLVLAHVRLLPAPDPAAARAACPARDRAVGVLPRRAGRRPRPRPGRASTWSRTAWTSASRPAPTPSRCAGRTGSTARTCSWSARASRARTSPRSPTPARKLRELGHRAGVGGIGARLHARRARRRRCARSGTWRSATCPGSTPARSRSPCRRCTRASACRCSRRWPAACRSSPPTAPRCRRPVATRRCWWTPTTATALADALADRGDRRGPARGA